MKRAAVLVPVILVAFSMSLAVGAQPSKDEAPDYSKTIPPEILRLYDPGLLDGSRPKLVAITQEMIWSLRSQPDQGGDVYTLDFDPGELSTVQKNVLLEWIKAGHNVLITGDECAVYWATFPGFTEPKEAKNCPGPLPVTLAEHAANADCANVTFHTESEGKLRRTDGTYGIGHSHLYFSALDEDAIIVASLDRGMRSSGGGGPVAGCMPYGRGGVYFITKLPQGSDTDRWTLNFRQWMLGLPIPGAAETAVTQARNDTDDDRRVTLRGGLSFTSDDEGSEITIMSGDTELTFGLGQVAEVMLEGIHGEAQTLCIEFRDGGEFMSEILPDAFSVHIERGPEPTVPPEQLDDVCLK